jgi:hypothetical protein
MKDPVIESKASELTSLVDRINTLMSELQDLNVEVRISYVERNSAKEISQGISLWKVEERNGYL